MPQTPAFIVGIGTSAGGLEPLERIFENMPSQTGLAFVVVQHRDADLKCLLAQLQARQTALEIQRVDEPTPVHANAVYLLPPHRRVRLDEGRLRPCAAAGDEAERPIDTFFRHLAQDQRDRAVGVVLSGSGSDGAEGVRDIHSAGGLVIVQDEETAQFEGMPRAARATGVVDYVVAPNAITPTLLRHLRYPLGLPSEALVAPPDSSLDELYTLLRVKFGVPLLQYRQSPISKRIERRMVLHRLASVTDYLDRLRDNPCELEALYHDLLIGPTGFFREEEAFARLECKLLPQLMEEASAEGLRFWVPGCASGEEAYTLALLCHEQMQNRPQPLDVKIFATDIHPGSLEKADVGLYAADQLEHVTCQRRDRYFAATGEQFQVGPELRQLVLFSRHNLLNDPPYTRLDLVSCRNLLTHLRPETRARALGLLKYALRPGGLLVLGLGEGVSDLAGEFDMVDAGARIFRKRREARLPATVRIVLPDTTTTTPRPVCQTSSPEQTLQRAYEALLGELAPAGLLLTDQRELLHVFGNTGELFLRPLCGRFSGDVLDLVREELRPTLSAALPRALTCGIPASEESVEVATAQGLRLVKLTVRPLADKTSGKKFLLVQFADVTEPRSKSKGCSVEAPTGKVRALEEELHTTRRQLQAFVDELQRTNEDLHSANARLTASNAELQHTNEELHSLNQELRTVNVEYQRKIDALTQLNTDMDHLLRSTNIGTIFLDRDLKIRKFTPAIAASFNLVACDLGRPLEAISYNFVHDRLLADVREVLASGRGIEREVRHRQGATLLMRILPYRTQREAIEGVVLTFVDISAVKQTEEALRQSEQRYHALAESSLDALFILSAGMDEQSGINSFTFVDLNTRGEQLLGKPRDYILGQRLHNLLPVPEGDVLQRYRKVVETGKPLLEEFPCRDTQGRTVWLQHQVIRFLDGIAITTRDITERKLADAALQESEQRLQGILENTPAAIYLKDRQGRYLLVNRRFAELFALTLEPGQELTDADFLPPTLAAQFLHSDLQVLAHGETLEGEEILDHANPSSTFLTVRFPVRDATGSIYAVAGIMTDITARKGIEQLLADRAAQLGQANDVLHRRNEELDEFTYMASHDLQEPLRTLRIYSDLLLGDLGGTLPEQAAQDLEFIKGAAKQMQRLIDDLLTLSRASLADMQQRCFPLRRCAIQAIANLSARIKQASVEVAIDELPEVCGDELLLVQLFQNLIGNAVKFHDPGRHPVVRIGAITKEGQRLFFVQDNGLGIKPEHQEKIFAPFQKLHSREEHTGSGIGLAICRKVVDRHQGRLWVESQPGAGDFLVHPDNL